MNPELASVIRNIGSSDDADAIKKALEIIKAPKQRITASDVTVVAKTAEMSIDLINNLADKLNDAIREIEWLRSYADKDLDAFLISVQAELTNYATCKQAATVYNIDWFAQLPFSDEGLKRVATMLINTCEPVIGERNINPVWNDISAGNIATFNRLNELVKDNGDPASADE